MPTLVKLLHKRHTLSVTKRKLGYKHTTTVVAGQSKPTFYSQQVASQPNTKEGLTSNHGLGESITRCSKTSKIYCLRRGTSYSALPSPWVLLQGLYQPPTEVVSHQVRLQANKTKVAVSITPGDVNVHRNFTLLG